MNAQEDTKLALHPMEKVPNPVATAGLPVVVEIGGLPKEFPKEVTHTVVTNVPVKDESNNTEENIPVTSDVATYDVIAAAVASAHSTTFSVETTETTAAVANEILPKLSIQESTMVQQDTENKALVKDTISNLPEASNPSSEVLTDPSLITKTPIETTISCLPSTVKINDTRKLLQCPKCPSTFYSRSGYYRHTKKCGIPLEKAAHIRKMSKLAKSALKRVPPKFTRPVLHPSVIQEDKVSHRITYKCPKCPSDFFSKSGFYKHIKRCKAGKLN